MAGCSLPSCCSPDDVFPLQEQPRLSLGSLQAPTWKDHLLFCQIEPSGSGPSGYMLNKGISE